MDTGPQIVLRALKKTNTKTCAWCFTLNNYREKEVVKAMEWLEENCVYAIFGYEYSADGVPHLQGYFRTKRTNSIRYILKCLGAEGRPRSEAAGGRGPEHQSVTLSCRRSVRSAGGARSSGGVGQ